MIIFYDEDSVVKSREHFIFKSIDWKIGIIQERLQRSCGSIYAMKIARQHLLTSIFTFFVLIIMSLCFGFFTR